MLPVSIEATGKGRSGKLVTRNALKLHSFMELLVLIAFYRANPAVSITPATAAGVGEGAGVGVGEGVGEGEEALEAPLQQVEAPLPGCLQMMLAKHVLKAAKRNELRRTRRLMESDDPACAALAKARPELQKVFDALP